MYSLEKVKSQSYNNCSLYRESSFNDCVLNLISQRMMPNCLPPWIGFNKNISKQVNICPNFVQLTKEQQILYNRFSRELVLGYIPDELSVCPSPCMVMKYTIKKTFRASKLEDSHYINIKFKKQIVVKTEALQYGPVDMLVEIGSSLGLWLGLSALDLLMPLIKVDDYIRQFFRPKSPAMLQSPEKIL